MLHPRGMIRPRGGLGGADALSVSPAAIVPNARERHEMPPPSTLIIPIENQVRELDAKLLLACVAVERGFPVVLGSRAFIHYAIASLPRGVYLAKSMRRLSNRMFGILGDLGHVIVASDEEGLVRGPDDFYHSRRLSETTLERIAMLFAWGENDAKALRSFPGVAGIPIHVTGNPRIDLLRKELRHFFDPQVETLRSRFGPYVLVNTNFGLVNHFVSKLGDGVSLPEGRPRASRPSSSRGSASIASNSSSASTR